MAGLWHGPDGKPLPFDNHTEVIEFLEEADITLVRELSSGTNRPKQVRLEKDGVVAHGIFRNVDRRKGKVNISGKVHISFHDGYIYERAAYVLSRQLGIHHVPPCVERRFQGEYGTLQLWVENAITEKDRRDQNRDVENPMFWLRHKQTMRLFDTLIANIDRNQGNFLIDDQQNIWFIDHTRSFGISDRVEELERLVWCERDLWKNLQNLDRKSLEKHLGEYLSGKQLQALESRRSQLVNHLSQRISELGEGAVLYSGGELQPDLTEIDPTIDDMPRDTSLPVFDG